MTAAGAILEVGGARGFVPAEAIESIAPLPRVTPVPGAPPALLGMVVHGGRLLAVIALAEAARGVPTRHMLVWAAGDARVGLVGMRIVRTGLFPAEGDGVRFEGGLVPPFDVRARLDALDPRY